MQWIHIAIAIAMFTDLQLGPELDHALYPNKPVRSIFILKICSHTGINYILVSMYVSF